MQTAKNIGQPLRSLVQALEAARAGSAQGAAIDSQLGDFMRGAGEALPGESAQGRKLFRETTLEELTPVVSTAGLLRAVRRRTEAGARNFSALRRAMVNVPSGEDPAAEAFDRCLLSANALSALRARRTFFRRELRYRFQRSPLDRPFRVLSFGAGPGDELLEFLREQGPQAGRVQATLLDGDADCAAHMRQQLGNNGISSSLEIRQLDPVRAALIDETSGMERQDFIYAPCLFDFLPDEVAAKCLEFIYRLLSPRGQFFLAHYHRDLTPADQVVLEWWLEWYPYFRTPQEVGRLLSKSGLARAGRAAGLVRGPNVYVVVERPPDDRKRARE
ncbi:MAG: methyltransferase domain-containing protein [Planctomycetota bacterium]